MLGNVKISGRLMMIVATAVIGMTATAVFGLINQRDSLLVDRATMVRSIVQTADSVANDFHKRASAGEMSDEEARRRALATIGAMRYGNGDYVFVFDEKGMTLAHAAASLVGTSLFDRRTPDGRYFIREMIDAAKAGGGFVSYLFPRSGGSVAEPKVSYQLLFKPWGWMIGSGIYVDDVDALFWHEAQSTGAIALVLILLVAAMAFVIGRSISRPLASITGAMTRLAGGDRSVAIEYADRRDEIGSLAKALTTFKANADEMERLRQQQEEMKRQAEVERRRAMLQLADHFDSEVGAIVHGVGNAATKLKGASAEMTGIAERTGHSSTVVAAGSEEASANVSTVAAATEQLTSSISEISRQVSQASQVAQKASSDAASARATVNGLAEAAQKIGDVVKLISSIASQTNLLALNATIEAARAGDAGKGFAVVAGEVKSLATQTAKATDDITQQIASIQEASANAVTAIAGIGTIIEQINQTSAMIAAAVEEQGAATREIARNVEQAAAGTQQVSSNITDVRDGAISTGEAAKEVLGASGDLSAQVDRLRGQVGEFLSRIRAA
ncbi:MAG: HAMP domain-containing protein [Azospirillum sp.]|nr:HAMP domain-containing protein [Azospirillum sp.]